MRFSRARADKGFNAGGNMAFDNGKSDSGIGVSTGFDEFDRLTGGLRGGDLILLAGRPGVGKTALAIRMALHAALRLDKPVCYFSLEMDKAQLVRRFVFSMAGIGPNKLVREDLSKTDWVELTQADDQLSKAPIYIDDTPKITVAGMLERVRRLKNGRSVGLVVVDYLQLMTGPAERPAKSLLDIAASLKNMAGDLGIPVIALSCLRRPSGSRTDSRPVLSDLSPHGFEQLADIICLLHSTTMDKNTGAEAGRRVTELIVAKNRNGPIGSVKLS
jgi:replicative DNA helicase